MPKLIDINYPIKYCYTTIRLYIYWNFWIAHLALIEQVIEQSSYFMRREHGNQRTFHPMQNHPIRENLLVCTLPKPGYRRADKQEKCGEDPQGSGDTIHCAHQKAWWSYPHMPESLGWGDNLWKEGATLLVFLPGEVLWLGEESLCREA